MMHVCVCSAVLHGKKLALDHDNPSSVFFIHVLL